MINPAGVECKFFYGDYYRGKNVEECRLIGSQDPPADWKPQICSICPVPDILRANACEHMILSAEIARRFFGLQKFVKISAYCKKSNQQVEEPRIGCGECHPLTFIVNENSQDE